MEPRITGDERLVYLDTSTPMIREDGSELIDPEIFLKRVPLIFKRIVRSHFLAEIQNRHYDTREMAKDLVADFMKEGMEDLLPDLLAEANLFLDGLASDPPCGHITQREAKKRYRRDGVTRSLFSAGRRLDRFAGQKVLRRKHP
ncbi:MAG: hypothetical protein JJE48_02930 [Actinobacteria bacterium]|nr:hypothetical protein [Actinomycetota bacterium]